MYKACPITLGEKLRSFEVDGFLLTETKHPPALTLPRHLHECANISFVLQGNFTETVGTRSHECRPMSLVIKPPREVHSDQYGSDGAHCLIIEVKPNRLQGICALYDILNRAGHLQAGQLGALCTQVYKEFRIQDTASGLTIEGLIFEMLGEATRRSLPESSSILPEWLKEVKDFCHTNFMKPFSLVALAETVEVHPAHLARTFRKHYLCSVGDYIRRLRLDYAAEELISTNRSMVEIALQAGFYDQSHFTHSFKLHMGMTPTQFQREMKRRKNLATDTHG